MEPEKVQLIGLVEQRLRNLRELGQEILATQQACISADADALRTHDSHKLNLCMGIHRLDLEIRKVTESLSPEGSLRSMLEPATGNISGVDEASARRLRVLFEESETARAEVQRLNRVYAYLLAGSRNTLNVLINVFSHCLGVYPPLDAAQSRTTIFERSY